MRIKYFYLILIIFFNNLYSQSFDVNKKNELKLNIGYVFFGISELTYERIVSEKSSFGISLLHSFNKETSIKMFITPYYRYYFGKKYSSGFFIEGFSSINTTRTFDKTMYTIFSNNNVGNYQVIQGKEYTDVGIGASLGTKWATGSGFIFEIYAGIGKNILDVYKKNENNNNFSIIPRLGIDFGYRF